MAYHFVEIDDVKNDNADSLCRVARHRINITEMQKTLGNGTKSSNNKTINRTDLAIQQQNDRF